jgi:DNA replication and repair protein RecF
MYLNKLTLTNFKNYNDASCSMHSKLNCFVGNNGEGKTNLLDAIYYTCMCKSYFSATDIHSIRQGEDYMLIKAELYRNNKEEEILCGLQSNKKKQFRRNKKEYQRLNDHIGLFPIVMVSPADIQLITEGSDERRKYINSVISQYHKVYLDNIIHYNRILTQRNKTLKEFQSGSSQAELLDIYDEQMVGLGTEIYKERLEFINKFTPIFNSYYNLISGGKEQVELVYQSQITGNNYAELLHQSRKRDLAIQYSTVGIHKDDLILNLSKTNIRLIGSQGQQKTYLVAMKLAQFDFLKSVSETIPLLLLDDIFDKFDAGRVRQILKLVASEAFGQIFITHTNLDRMNAILEELDIDHKLFQVSNGEIVDISETEKQKA